MRRYTSKSEKLSDELEDALLFLWIRRTISNKFAFHDFTKHTEEQFAALHEAGYADIEVEDFNSYKGHGLGGWLYVLLIYPLFKRAKVNKYRINEAGIKHVEYMSSPKYEKLLEMGRKIRP